MVEMMLTLLIAGCLLGAVSSLTQVEVDQFYGAATKVTINGETISFESDGNPDHAYGPFPSASNPNTLSKQDHSTDLPTNPTVAGTPSCLPLDVIGYAINGIPFFNPFSKEGKNAVEGASAEVFDTCDGHPQQSGVYHYHKMPSCLYNSTADQLLGVALDGFPIYSPVTSAGTLTPADLDQCNGREVSGKYRYHMTTHYPYIIGCFKGTPSKRCKRIMGPPKGDRPEGGKPTGMGPPPQGMGGGGCYFANKDDWNTDTLKFKTDPKDGENNVDMECSACSVGPTLITTLVLSLLTVLNHSF